MTIAVVDYGAGNLTSVLKMLERLGEEPQIARTPEAILPADRIVLPGVGAAGEAVEKLRGRGLDAALDETVRKKGRPFLGICLGMQLLAERLYEFGEHRGLGWVEGEVRHINEVVDGHDVSVPHMGWNRVDPTPSGMEFFKRGSPQEFYFAHSYTLRPSDSAVVAAYTGYGVDLVSAVRFDSVFATQFHPEKSQVEGEKLLAAFLDWRP